MVFMMGMYCKARSPDTDRIRMRERREGGVASDAEGALIGFVTEGPVVAAERRVCCLLM